MDANVIQRFVDRIKSERKELKEDLMGLSLSTTECKVGDFGCGWGYITWCLMLELPTCECVGIDKFDPKEPPTIADHIMLSRGIPPSEMFTIDNVQGWCNEFLDGIKSGTIELQDYELLNDIRRKIIAKERVLAFQKGNLITGENLPLENGYFNIIYCKRLLNNIHFGNNASESLKKVVNYIASLLKPSGWFCFVEIEDFCISSNLEESLILAGFSINNHRTVPRLYEPDKVLSGIEKTKYRIYQCQKT